ncbi:hypothetical protein QOT17_019359 [Balamuthia mandrillaris]
MSRQVLTIVYGDISFEDSFQPSAEAAGGRVSGTKQADPAWEWLRICGLPNKLSILSKVKDVVGQYNPSEVGTDQWLIKDESGNILADGDLDDSGIEPDVATIVASVTKKLGF